MTKKTDKIIKELELWSVDDLVPGDLQGLCNEAANELRRLNAAVACNER